MALNAVSKRKILLSGWPILLLGLVISTYSAFYVYQMGNLEDQIRFEVEADEIISKIKNRFERYEAVLLQARAFFKSSDLVTREDFRRYFINTEITTRYPGLQGMGYTVRLRPQELRSHIKKVRTDIPDYRVWPDTPREEYHSIVLIEPMDWRNKRAIGFDMFSHEVRREAMMRARDTGQTAMSGLVRLVQENNVNPQPGFLIYVPHYGKGHTPETLEERRRLLQGFVYSAFRSYDLFQSLFRNYAESIDIEVFSGDELSSETLMYDHDGAPRFKRSDIQGMSLRKEFEILGREFTLKIFSLPGFYSRSTRYGHYFVFISGLLITSLLLRIFFISKKQAEVNRLSRENLYYQAQLTKTITDNAASALFMKDKHGHPTYMNPAAKRLTGYTSLDEIKDRPLHYALHWKRPDGSYYPLEECPIDNALSVKKQVQNQEEIFCKKDGTLFPVSFSVSPLEKSGEMIGSVLEFRDISDIHHKEEALKTAVRTRDEFLSIASHELKTPVTSLQLQLQIASKGLDVRKGIAPPPEKLEKVFAVCLKQVSRLSGLIEDLLDISRIESGKLKLQKKKTNISSLLREIVERHEEQVRAAGCELRSEIPSDIHANCDSFRLEQVLSNLITNAAKYAAGTAIKISLQERDDKVLINVEDKGGGIPSEKLGTIFERFERAVADHGISGLGLGLYISKQIMLAHGGDIKVKSAPGEGSTFTAELPHTSKEST